mmetsp:Transcript_30616/g.71548  ORF Transcript_30616/g.71548 Transcript_30616/m.71548 type:complete len:511 (+) Transcript_30616:69-1601(+)
MAALVPTPGSWTVSSVASHHRSTYSIAHVIYAARSSCAPTAVEAILPGSVQEQTAACAALRFTGVACTGLLLVGVTSKARRVSSRRRRGGLFSRICLRSKEDDSGTSSGKGQLDQAASLLRPDLFLQLPFANGVLLSGVLWGIPKIPLLPEAADGPMPLALVPVQTSSDTQCVPHTGLSQNSAAAKELRRTFFPGPMRPCTPTGLALLQHLQESIEEFKLVRDYDLKKKGLGQNFDPVSQAESLILGTYAVFNENTGAPPRPGVGTAEYQMYIHFFSDSAAKALQEKEGSDFQMIVQAHVLSLAGSASMPRVPIDEARDMYASGVRFGHALRQAERCFEAEKAAGTFMPAALELKLARKELEVLYHKSDSAITSSPGTKYGKPRQPSAPHQGETDAEAAHRSLEQAVRRVARMGDVQLNLATYMGWIGRYDAEALSLLATPSPVAALAIKKQVNAIFGATTNAGDVANEEVMMTPSDLIEAVLFGAWLRDVESAGQAVIDEQTRHTGLRQ